MTPEEMETLINEQRETIENLEAERNSFRTENERLIAADKERAEELRKTKELNFTLARQIDTRKSKSLEQTLMEAFT